MNTFASWTMYCYRQGLLNRAAIVLSAIVIMSTSSTIYINNPTARCQYLFSFSSALLVSYANSQWHYNSKVKTVLFVTLDLNSFVYLWTHKLSIRWFYALLNLCYSIRNIDNHNCLWVKPFRYSLLRAVREQIKRPCSC